MLICRHASVIKVERNLAFNTIWHSVSVICEKYNMSFLKLHSLFCKGTWWCRKPKQTEGARKLEWRWRVWGTHNAIGKIWEKGVIWSCGGCVQVDVRARREQQGIKRLFSMLWEWCSSSGKLVTLTRRPWSICPTQEGGTKEPDCIDELDLKS